MTLTLRFDLFQDDIVAYRESQFSEYIAVTDVEISLDMSDISSILIKIVQTIRYAAKNEILAVKTFRDFSKSLLDGWKP